MLRLITAPSPARRSISAAVAAGSRPRGAAARAARSPAASTPRFTPRRRGQASDDATRSPKGQALFLVGCASCHGMNGEGITDQARQAATAPRWSASAPPRSTSRSAPAGCRWPSPAPGPAQEGPSTPRRRSAQLAAYVASLGPGPAVPDSPSTTSARRRRNEASSAAASSSAPTARRATTSPAPAARCPAASTRRADAASPRSTSTRPC